MTDPDEALIEVHNELKLFKVTYSKLIDKYSEYERKITGYENIIDKLQLEISKLREQNKQICQASAIRSRAPSQIGSARSKSEIFDDDYRTLYSPVPIRLPDKNVLTSSHNQDKIVIPPLRIEIIDDPDAVRFKRSKIKPRINLLFAPTATVLWVVFIYTTKLQIN